MSLLIGTVILITSSIYIAFTNCESDNFSIYRGYKIIEVFLRSPEHIYELQRLENRLTGLNILGSIKTPTASQQVLVPPNLLMTFQNILSGIELDHRIIDNNVFETLQKEQVENGVLRETTNMSINSYFRYDEILDYVEGLVQKYPEQVTLLKFGKSYQGRQMLGVRITDKASSRTEKKVIFIDAGIHAREWIAPATALFTIHQLVESFDTNQQLLKDYDWVIVPVVNPDGYEYSHTKERFWRKTRQPHSFLCVGTDANRNFDFHWGEDGASTNACSETFRGPKPFSEPETAAIRQILTSFDGRCKMYLSLHSYGRYLLYPWGYASALPPTWKDLDEVARSGADAIRKATGVNYTVGSATNVLYAASGASDDYAFGAIDIPISITMELPGGGRGGFDPPPKKIKPFVDEAWLGIRAMAEAVIKKY